MNPRNLLRVVLFLALCVATFNTGSHASAQTSTPPPIQIVVRGLSYWDAIYIGNVGPTRYENWPFTFGAAYSFTITATTTSGDLIPLLILYDGNGNEISSATNTLTSTQPVGSYSVQIQPVSGSGTYSLTIRQVAATPTPGPTSTPIFTNTPTPAITNTPVGTNTPVATNTPAATSTPVVTNTPAATNTPVVTNTPVPSATPTFVFTPTAVNTAIPTATPASAFVTIGFTPSNIVALGGATTVSVNLNNVPASGFASVEFTCTFDPLLVSISNIADSGLFGADAVMVINGPQSGSFIVAIAGSNGNKATTSGPAFTFSANGLLAGQSAIDCQARVSTGNLILTTIPSSPASLTITSGTATPVNTPVPTTGTFSGQVLANKPVTVTLYNPDTSVAGSVAANVNGTFSLSVSAGTYVAVASAPGYLKAQGSFTITGGNTTTAQTISPLAGDIDGNDIIDQFDALTIGINYNGSTPTAADLNNDGVINVLDMEILAPNYRQAGALAWQ